MPSNHSRSLCMHGNPLSSWLPSFQIAMTSLDRFINVVLRPYGAPRFFHRFPLSPGPWNHLTRQFHKIRQTRQNSRHLPTSGFRDDLFKNGQQGQMYRHLYVHHRLLSSGSTDRMASCLGSSGLTDIKQAASGRMESSNPRCVDNVAGRECGKILTLLIKVPHR